MASESQPGARRRLFDYPYLLLAAASLFWSGNHIVGRAVAGHVPPYTLSTLRWMVGAVILWPFVHRHVMRDLPLIRRHAAILLFLGMLGGTAFSALNYLSLQLTSALNVSVFNSLAPVLIAGVAALTFRDRLSAAQTTGIGISLGGAIAIVSQLDWRVLAGFQVNDGDLLVVLNMLIFAVYSVSYRLRPPIHWLSFTFVLSVISVIGTTPLMVWELGRGAVLHADWTTIGAVAYVAIFPSIGAYICWNRGIELIGANRSGVFLHLVPLYSALMATLFLGEQLRLYHVLGFILILTGVHVTTRAPR
jgi:drug/metabolite transporter (DMT)-like permease